MSNYIFNVIDTKSSNVHIPFEVTAWTGSLPDGFSGEMYMVKSGDCFSTFSYSLRDKVDIKGLNSGFAWEPNSKVYLDFTVLSNLQVSGASVKVGPIGSGIKTISSDKILSDPTGWIDFPYMFRTFPEDIKDANGFIKKIADGKRQTHSYLLLAIRSDDTDPYGMGNQTGDSSSFQIVQKVNTNLLMMMGGHNGVPVTFPMPWFAGSDPSGENFLA